MLHTPSFLDLSQKTYFKAYFLALTIVLVTEKFRVELGVRAKFVHPLQDGRFLKPCQQKIPKYLPNEKDKFFSLWPEA